MRGQAVLALWAAVALGCPEKGRPKQEPSVLATVNGEPIARSEFEQELSRELRTVDPTHVRTPEEVEPLKRALLATLLDRTLLLQAARAANLSVTQEEVERHVLKLSADYPAEGFEEALAQGNTSLADLKRKTAQLLTVEKLFQEQVYPRVAVTEEEIRRYHQAHAAQLDEPEKVHVAQIVVNSLDEARRVQAQLRAGKKFSELALRFSLAPEAKVGGDLGFFPRGVMPSQFDEVVFRLGTNQVSEVVSSDYGFHLFKVLEKKPARRRELAEVRRLVEEKLLEERRAQAQQEYVLSLKEKADIQVNEQAVRSASGSGPRGVP